MTRVRTTITQRKRILRLFNQGRSLRAIAGDEGITYDQAYSIVSGRVKTTFAPRTDKGTTRKHYSRKDSTSMDAARRKAIGEGESVYEFFRHQLIVAMEKLEKKKNLDPGVHVKILKDISYIKRNIQMLELEKHINRPDAVLIARLMRRFQPALTDDDIIKIYREEYERMIAENK